MISKYNKKFIIFILQLIIVMNAVNMGWSINKINDNKIILSKKISKISYLDDNLYDFMNNVIPTHI
jgi:hypothetical protein